MRSKLYLLKKLSYHIPRHCLTSILDGFFVSRIRYCLEIYGQPAHPNLSTKPDSMKRLQILLNAVMRIATGTRISDKIKITELQQRTRTISVNQLCAYSIINSAKSIHDHNTIPEIHNTIFDVHPYIKLRHERLGRTRKRHSVGFNRREVSPSGLQKYGTCYQPALGAFPSQLSKSSLKLSLLPLLINKKLVTVSRTVCF